MLEHSDSEGSASNETHISFGIGCFHFSADDWTMESSLHDYYGNVETLLNSIPHVTNISIQKGDTTRYSAGQVSNSGDIAYDEGISPWLADGVISFNIRIPKRFHKDYIFVDREIKTENFLVRIVYNGGLPVAFIYSLDVIEEQPSTMVVIVRKHLEKTLSAHGRIRFVDLGPSPFHADFYVRFEDVTELELTYSRQLGYDDVEIILPLAMKSSVFNDELEVRVASEVGFFYEAVQKRNVLNAQISDLLSDVEVLSTDYEDTKLLRRIARRMFPPTNASKLRIKTERAEISIAEFERSWLAKRDETITVLGASMIESKMSREVEELKNFPLPAYRNIASAIDSRLTVAGANRLVLVAAVVSGIVSVAVTLSIDAISARNPSTSSPPDALLTESDTRAGPESGAPQPSFSEAFSRRLE